jgi:hypothetical protein
VNDNVVHQRFGTLYVQWAQGVLVPEADFALLERDVALLGSAYVEVTGGYGRRIAPENLKSRFRKQDAPQGSLV